MEKKLTVSSSVIYLTLVLPLAILLTGCSSSKPQPEFDATELVNPLMGTDSDYKLSHGNTYPAIAVPWGMNFWTPQTGKMGSGWIYQYDATKICGLRQTHQPSPWINDYAAFSFMPVTGKLVFDENERASWFSHKTEIVKPYHYSVYLADHDVTAEVTPSERAAILRFTFPASDSSYILLDAFDEGSEVKIIPGERKITGYCRNNSGGVPENFHNYFVAVFDKDFSATYTWRGDTLEKGSTYAKGNHTGAVIAFKTSEGEKINIKVASSFISAAQAELNLKREIGNSDFEKIKTQGYREWKKELGRIMVEGGTEEQRRTFYSCLYRMMLFPRPLHEINEKNEIIHFSPYNGKVLPGYLYTDNGFWDTFRAAFPFLTLMYPELDSKIMQGLVNTYLESGWLPEWASPGHRDCMIGSNSASLIADAWLKGIKDFDINLLYDAILKNTNGPGPVNSVGRLGAEYYNKLGYVPYNVGINENAARTLEYAYADFCIWKLAKELNRPAEEIELFASRAMNYKNVFDTGRKLMRGRNEDGSFQTPFSPYKWGDAFTEGNSWHYTWSVFHDVAGLVKLMGGEEQFALKLDSVFEVPPVFDYSYYGTVIHEIREMQIMNMGNYAHGNQPIQHMIYLYNYCGQPWKSQYHARNVMSKLYSPAPDGYCGDEDNGQTSAWYVFSALGFYPVTPGTNQYVFGSPMFRKATLDFGNGRKLVIDAPENTPEAVYIRSITLNGRNIARNFISHEDLLKGGKLLFEMAVQPNRSRGVGEKSYPFSMSTPASGI